MPELFSNLPVSTLATAAVSAQTTLTVATGGGSVFPTVATASGDYFKIVVYKRLTTQYEIIKVSGRSGDLFSSITRAQDGTSALSFNAGDEVRASVLASFLTRVVTQDGAVLWGVGTGTASSQIVTMTPPLTEFVTGMEIRFQPNASNTGNTNLNVDSLGDKNILKPSGGVLVELAADDMITTGVVSVIYTGTEWQLGNVP